MEDVWRDLESRCPDLGGELADVRTRLRCSEHDSDQLSTVGRHVDELTAHHWRSTPQAPDSTGQSRRRVKDTETKSIGDDVIVPPKRSLVDTQELNDVAGVAPVSRDAVIISVFQSEYKL
jgi:hypothetical protein